MSPAGPRHEGRARRDAKALGSLAGDCRIDVADDLVGRTVTEAIRLALGRISWRTARSFVQDRRVTVNGVLCLDPARRLTAGEVLVVHEGAREAPPAPSALAILHLDRQLVVFDKPAGLVVERHAAERAWPARRKALQPVVEELLPAEIARREGGGARPARLVMVHRLDRETSGVMVAARGDAAAAGLIERFARHDVDRVYFAICRGRLASGTIRSRLVRDRGDGRRGSGEEGDGQLAVTHVERLSGTDAWSLVRCRLETGRTHQIRIHLAEAGHPVLGDKRYGGADPLEAESESPRHALHAAELGFEHPTSGERLAFRSPLPADFESVLARLRGDRA